MDLEAIILSVAQRAPSVLTPTQLARAVRQQATRRVQKASLEAALRNLVEGGQIRELHGFTRSKKPTPVYTTLNDPDLAAALLEPRLGTGAKPVKQATLPRKLPAVLQPHFEAAVERLIATGSAYRLPHKPGYLLARKPRPSDVVDASKARTLRTLLANASTLRSAPVSLEDFLAWLDADTASETPTETAFDLTPERLREWYLADVESSSTRMIPIPLTWRRYQSVAAEKGFNADSQQLRRIMDFLYKEGQICLEPSDRPQELTESEQALLVPLSLGPPGYYWCWLQ